MTQQEILEGNKVIAEFDCYVYVKFTDYESNRFYRIESHL